ncbi:MAG: biopolymer transport protein ExbD [Saprospiraceae bacterium]|jgi:biopolymer transport protein ExbD
MGLKKRQKPNAEFNMSSLTDIIFLLLIFFMLTSSVVAPNALNLKMPGNSNSSVTADSKTDDVSIDSRGKFFFNGTRIGKLNLESRLSKNARRKRSGKYKMTISPKSGAKTEDVVTIMDMAMRLNIDGILAVEK